jgi:tRNA threonylcarbamoyladenosine biosynthesis protein TsaE
LFALHKDYIIRTEGGHQRVKDETLSLTTRSLSETQRLGAALGRLLRGDEVICLEGELGSGKTSLIQGIGRGLEVAEPITSPTFTLVNEYQGRRGPMYHVDLYRLNTAHEIVAAGIDGYIYGDGISVIEWAEKAGDVLPHDCLYVTLSHVNKNERTVALKAKGRPYQRLLRRLRKVLESDDGIHTAGH